MTAFLDYLTYCQKDLGQVIEHFHEFLERHLAGEGCPDCEFDGTKSAKSSKGSGK